jgi:hypothetical protein
LIDKDALLHPLTPNTVVKGCKSCSYKLFTSKPKRRHNNYQRDN